MKTLTLFSSSLLLAAAMPRVSAVEQLIVGWDQTWNYFQPMGAATDPAIADPTWNTTWFTTGVSFGAASTGIAGDATTFDRGTGDGPFGYDVIEYMTSAAPEFSSFGQTLTQPASGSRGAAYFRTTFTTPANATPWSNIRIRMCLDDGALIYLDGVLIARVNKANNTEAWNAFATDTTATFNETLASANDEAVIQSFVLNATGTSTTAESTVVVPVLTLAGGSSHILAVSTRNNNFTSSDMCFAMELRADDAPPLGVTPVATSVVRSDNGTPTNPNDDTVGFTLNVSGVGALSPTWTISSPAALAGTSGSYGVDKVITGVPIAEFSGAGHTMGLTVTDTGNPGVTGSVTVTAPWATLVPVVSNVARQAGPTADPSDDTWSYSITVNGQFTGAGWTADNLAIPSGSYGVIQNIAGLTIIATPTETTTFADAADPTATVTITVSAPRVIGTKNFGTAQPLFSDNGGVPVAWVVDESAKTQTMNNGGGAPARVYRSEVINLSAVGDVTFSATLQVDDISSGFEPGDTFNAQLIIDGNTAAPVSLITAYDTITPPDGVLTGAELTPLTPGPPPATGPGSFPFPLSAAIPATANSVQLVISGNNDSANETMLVQSILFVTTDNTDSDGDGLPDSWETTNFGNLSQSATDDFDQDGANNGNEYAAGTNPTNPKSQLAIVSVAPVVGGYQLTWTSVPGKVYRADYSTDLSSWTDVGVDIPASAGSTTSAPLPVGSPAPSRLFSRIRIK